MQAILAPPMLVIAIACLGACSGDDASSDASAVDSQQEVCDEFARVAQDVGCAAEQDCSKINAACSASASDWLECVKTDLSQCQCESDGNLNCEGSYKPNEGPARCIAEFEAFNACLE